MQAFSHLRPVIFSYPCTTTHSLSPGGMDMVMGWIFTGILLISLFFSFISGNSGLSNAVTSGAQSGITLAVAMAGSICLWSGVGTLMEKTGITDMLSRLLSPVLFRIFPKAQEDKALARDLSANVCANILGLGNAATPMGIRATKRLLDSKDPGRATDQMCRLVVLNTASIQLIPANVAAVRASLGCAAPFDILPAVWVTSLCSAGLGVAAAFLLGKVWKN